MRVGFSGPRLQLAAGLSFAAELGPVTCAIERVGVEITYRPSVRAASDSNLAFALLPPTGAGLALAAGPVTGGGFIRHDKEAGSYSGILDLKFSEIGLVAVAIITTKFPDGRRGVAFFVNIGVTFSPAITLPYNFNLQGSSGLCAVNRTMNNEALRSGLRNKTLDSILFPEDPILNANKIISDSERVCSGNILTDGFQPCFSSTLQASSVAVSSTRFVSGKGFTPADCR